MAFGLLYANEFAKQNPSTEDFERRLDTLLIYLGKYAGQNAVELEKQPTVKLQQWANRLGEFLEEERRQAEAGR